MDDTRRMRQVLEFRKTSVKLPGKFFQNWLMTKIVACTCKSSVECIG